MADIGPVTDANYSAQGRFATVLPKHKAVVARLPRIDPVVSSLPQLAVGVPQKAN